MDRVVTSGRTLLFIIAWVIVTTAAYVLSGLIFHFPGAFPPNNGEVFNTSGYVGALTNGLATGILVGLGQTLLLRMIGRATWRWAAGTTAALWLIHTIGDVFPDGAALPLMTALGGFILGGAQTDRHRRGHRLAPCRGVGGSGQGLPLGFLPSGTENIPRRSFQFRL